MTSFRGAVSKGLRSRIAAGCQALVCAWGLVLTSPALAMAESLVRFDIAAQPLPAALKEFASQASMQLLYRYEAVDGAMANAVIGDFEKRAALEMLLRGTGLEVVFSKDNAATIRAARADSRSAPKRTATTSATDTTRSPGGTNGEMHLAQVEQNATQNPETAAKAERRVDDTVELGEVVVLGTHIRGAYPRSAPVSIFNRGDIERTGAATTDQFLRTLPQNLASIDPTANAVPQQDPIQSQGNAFHGGGVNIHGLGYNTTLVLLNGHRVAAAGSNAGFTDITLFPVSAIERVEVLSSGSSAIYGADAVAGVVNFVMRNDFDGAEATARYGDSTEGGGEEYGGSLALGHSWGNGNVMGIYDYLNQYGLQASERDFVSPDAGTRAIIPSAKRNSVFLTAAQRASSRAQLRADAFYSDRAYIDDSVLFGGLVVSHTDGDVTQWGFTPSATIDLSGNWKADIAANYSKLEQDTGGTSDIDAFDIHSAFTRDRVTEVSSLDIVTDGPVLTLAGGDVRAAVGAAAKVEEVDDFGVTDGSVNLDADLKRNSFSVFGELRIPLVGQANAKALAEQLELSIAARYDHYDEGGSKTTPQAGLSWSPITGVNIRGTYGQSFRVATLEQLVGVPAYFAFPVPNPDSPTDINTIFDSTGFNPDLGPEESTAYTLGFDLDDDLVRGLSFSASYFHIRFRDQIAAPIVRGGVTNLFNETDVLGPFIDLNPSQAEVDAIYASGFLFNPFNIPATAVGAIFNGRVQNLAESISEGIDLSARYEVDSRQGKLGIFASGSYLLALSYRGVPGGSTVELVDTLYNPPDLKLRGGVDWSRHNFHASLSVNYADSYANPLVTPTGLVDSWTTGDVQLSYVAGDAPAAGAFANLSVLLSVINVTDEPPPYVVTLPIFADVGYDPANASPLGRFVSLQIRKQW